MVCRCYNEKTIYLDLIDHMVCMDIEVRLNACFCFFNFFFVFSIFFLFLWLFNEGVTFILLVFVDLIQC